METHKENLKKVMRQMSVGEVIELPVGRWYTAKQYASDFRLLEGLVFKTHVDRKEGVVRVTRLG